MRKPPEVNALANSIPKPLASPVAGRVEAGLAMRRSSEVNALANSIPNPLTSPVAGRVEAGW